jgi:hypothetical protein
VEKDKGTGKVDKKRMKAKKMLVVLFMEGANKGFKPLMQDLENDHALGSTKYPTTLAEALQVMMLFADQLV